MIKPNSDFCSILITRLSKPDSETFGGIELEEWLDFIASDSELAFVEEVVGRNPATGGKIKKRPVGVARNIEETEIADDYSSLFHYKNGSIRAQRINLTERQKAVEIAAKLNAALIIISN